MKVIDKKESFKDFYARFSIAIASLEFINIYKIFNLKRLISIYLKYRILK